MRRTPLLLALLPLLALTACHRSKTPDLLTVSAAPPAPTSSVAAAAPVDVVPPPKPVPTPAATALAIGTARAGAATPPPRVSAGVRSGVASTEPMPCAGLRGAVLDACIERAARSDASLAARPAVGPSAVASAEEADFRAAQARRDRELMDRDQEETGALADARERDGAVDWRDAPEEDDLNGDGRVDWRDRRLAEREARRGARDDSGAYDPADVPYDEPPPDDDSVIYDEPPPDGDGYYPPRR